MQRRTGGEFADPFGLGWRQRDSIDPTGEPGGGLHAEREQEEAEHTCPPAEIDDERLPDRGR